jgi:hypothetical protein
MAKSINRRSRRGATRESRAADVATIGWMLTVTTTFACELGAAVVRWLAADDSDGPLDLLWHLLLFAAAVIGFISLLAVPVVIKSRRRLPPRGILAFALVVGSAPLAIVFAQLVR